MLLNFLYQIITSWNENRSNHISSHTNSNTKNITHIYHDCFDIRTLVMDSFELNKDDVAHLLIFTFLRGSFKVQIPNKEYI